MESFYTREDSYPSTAITEPSRASFVSGPATAGVWDPRFQHAGPPSALLARQMMQHHPREGFRLADIHVDILGPVPVAGLEVRTELIRGGRSMDLLQATAFSADHLDRPVLQARAWRILRAPEDYPRSIGRRDAGAPAVLPDDLPAGGRGLSAIAEAHLGGYTEAVEWRYMEGAPTELGPAFVWGRVRIPLVDGEEIAPWERLLVLADSAGGLSLPVDTSRYRFINCDLHVALDRDPEGEWIRMNAQSIATPGHGGIVNNELADVHGVLGTGLQTMVAAHLG